MPRQFSIRDIELLGYRDPKVISDTSSSTRVVGLAEAGIETIRTEFLYLKADCTSEQAQNVARSLSPTEKVFVLLPESHKLTEQTVRSVFSARAIDVAEIEAVVWKKLSTAFGKYLEELQRRIPEERYFVKPRKEHESNAQLDKELLAYFAGKGQIAPGTLAVVSAAAGVGKTTVARQATIDLLRQVNSSKVIPVFVEATHWDKFNLEANIDLWDIIRNSIDQFEGNVVLSQELFNYGLQQGYFVFIFDGFDELCSPKHSQFTPIDILRSLADLAKQSEARILITTRTIFWQNEIEKIGAPSNVAVLTLAPFNKAQAIGYFQERFKSSLNKRERAQTLYSKLVSHSDLPENEEGGARAKFANLPLVVVMLAEYIDRGGVNFDSQGQIIEDLLRRLCLRDQARQDLLAGAQEQLRAFEEVAVDWYEPVNPEFDLDTLLLVGFPKEDIRDIRHHALVAQGKSTNTHRFRWDFLAPFMRALFLRRVIQNAPTKDMRRATNIMQLEANGKGFVFEHLFALLAPTDLDAVARMYQLIPSNETDVRSFLAHLLMALINFDKDTFTTNAERTEAFFERVSSNGADLRVISDLSVVGQIEKLDFRGITFRNCVFRDVSFVNCLADNLTCFDGCVFSGSLDLNPADTWSNVQLLPNCTIRSPASLTWTTISKSSVADSEELIMDAFRLGLSKFWHNGSPRGNLKRDDWKRGLLGRTKYCQPILDALIKAGVVSESAKGQYVDPKLFFSKESFGDLQRFMDNRQLTGRIAEAFRQVSI